MVVYTHPLLPIDRCNLFLCDWNCVHYTFIRKAGNRAHYLFGFKEIVESGPGVQGVPRWGNLAQEAPRLGMVVRQEGLSGKLVGFQGGAQMGTSSPRRPPGWEWPFAKSECQGNW